MPYMTPSYFNFSYAKLIFFYLKKGINEKNRTKCECMWNKFMKKLFALFLVLFFNIQELATIENVCRIVGLWKGSYEHEKGISNSHAECFLFISIIIEIY